MGIHQPIGVGELAGSDICGHQHLQNEPAIRVEVIQDWAGFDQLETKWREVERQAHGATFFQSYDWCAINARQMREDCTRQPYVCCAYKGDKLVAILPLAILGKPLRKVLSGFAEPFQEFTDILALPDADAAAAYRAIHQTILKAPVDYVHLGQVRRDSVLAAAGEGLLRASGPEEGAPHVALTGWEDFGAYLDSRNVKTRRNMRNAINGLEKTGVVSHLKWKAGDELNGVIGRTFRGRSEWLKSKGLSSSAFRDDGFWKLLQNVMSESGKSLDLIGFSFRLDDHPVAEQWGFVYSNRYYAFLSHWDKDFHRVSPGRLQLGAILRACFDEGIEKAEFMLPAVPYKMTWADEVIKVQDYIFPVSIKGHLFDRIWFNLLRSRVKAGYLSAPKGIRRALYKMFFSGQRRAQVGP